MDHSTGDGRDDFDPLKLPIPDEETRKIQATIFKLFMQNTLTVDQLKQWRQYLDEHIIFIYCDTCYGGVITEVSNSFSPAKIEELAEIIVNGKCNCGQMEEDSIKEVYKLVHFACMYKDTLPLLRYMKDSGCDLSAISTGHLPTPLHVAIYHDHLEIVSYLLDCGVDMNYTEYFVDCPLAVALASEKDEIVETLLACKEIKVNITNRRNQTLLAHCVRVKSKYVERLLQAGANPNLTGPLHTSPLMYAVQMRNMDTVKLLLRYGADVNLKNSRDDVPLLIALYTGSVEIMEVLLDAGADPDFAHSDGNTPLLIACYDNQQDIVTLLLRYHASISKANTTGYMPIHVAAWNGRLETVRILLKAGAQHDKITNDKNTPLALAAHGGHLNVIQELLPLGCVVNNYDKDKDTPLHYAAYNGMTRGCEVLIEYGADPNCQSTCKATPLWNAVYKGKKDVVKLLLKLNVTMEIPSRGTHQHSHTDDVVHVYPSPKSPLWVAMDRKLPDIALLLVSAGYNIFCEHWLINEDFQPHFDQRMCSLLSQYVHTPPKLISLSRNFFRHYFKLDIIKRVEQLDIPVSLKKFLTLADLQYQADDGKVETVATSSEDSDEMDENWN